jgi:hypothetical protein
VHEVGTGYLKNPAPKHVIDTHTNPLHRLQSRAIGINCSGYSDFYDFVQKINLMMATLGRNMSLILVQKGNSDL